MAQQYQQAPLMSVQDYDGHSQGHLEVEHKGHVHGEVEWQSGLCGCCSPFSTCEYLESVAFYLPFP